MGRRPALGRDLRRGRPARRRAQHRHARARRGRRRSATSSSRTRSCGGINFTGSTGTGRRLAEAAGRHLKRVVLELGGQNPLIVLARRRPRLRRRTRRRSARSCTRARSACRRGRIIVERPIADEFIDAAGREDGEAQGRRPEGARHDHRPAHQPQALSTVAARVDDAVARGAKVLAGRRGRTARATKPTLARGRARRLRSRASRDVRAGRVDRGRRQRRRGGRRANETGYGLSAGIITRRPRPRHGAGRSRSTPASSTSTTRRSATSRRCRSAASRTAAGAASAGRAAMEEFTELRWVTVQSGHEALPVLSGRSRER